MIQFKKCVIVPNKKLPTSYHECNNMDCKECVLGAFLGINDCQFLSMLTEYKGA